MEFKYIIHVQKKETDQVLKRQVFKRNPLKVLKRDQVIHTERSHLDW
jgi:hypothetical protein